MATHSSILAWRFPWTDESGGLQSMGSQRVRHTRLNDSTTITFPSWVQLGFITSALGPEHTLTFFISVKVLIKVLWEKIF